MVRNMKYILTGLLCLIAIGHGNVHAQHYITDNQSAVATMQVKQLDEFMQRFNQRRIPGISEGTSTDDQKRALLSLFNHDVIEYRGDEALSFVSSILEHQDKMSYMDTGWYAIADCNVLYKKKSSTVTLVLQTEFIDDEMYKWVIMSADGDLLKLMPRKKSKMLKLFPTENELNFIQLKDVTTASRENILNYSNNGFEIDQTSVFYALVATGDLSVESVQELQYQFQTYEYTFWIKYYSRESTNSGWLIYDFKRR